VVFIVEDAVDEYQRLIQCEEQIFSVGGRGYITLFFSGVYERI
jgi:hypothetical protein